MIEDGAAALGVGFSGFCSHDVFLKKNLYKRKAPN
jgi:hypothetical protein